MNEEAFDKMMFEFAEKYLAWSKSKDKMIENSKDLIIFLNSFIGKTFKFKKIKYKIKGIYWEVESNIYGGHIHCIRQTNTFIGKILFQNEKFIHFQDFYKGLDDGDFVLEDF